MFNVWMNVYDFDLCMVFWNRMVEWIMGYEVKDVFGYDCVWEWCYLEGFYCWLIEVCVYMIVDEDYCESDYENELCCKDGSIRSI